jgi:hypothetical protein
MPRHAARNPPQHCYASQFGTRSTWGGGNGRGLRLLRWLRCKPQPSGGSPAMTKIESTPERR